MMSCNNSAENQSEVKEPTTAQIPEGKESALGTEEKSNTKTIVFFGDSLSAGYGVDETEAFPAITQAIIDSIGLNYKVINAGLSGETTAGGRQRLNWVIKDAPDFFVLELGGNDGLRGIPHQETTENLQDMISQVWSKNPDTKIILAGMESPPNMGSDYTNGFRQIFKDIAEANPAVVLIPFLLETVGGIPELNQRDGIHPTADGHKLVAAHVWKTLGPLLQ